MHALTPSTHVQFVVMLMRMWEETRTQDTLRSIRHKTTCSLGCQKVIVP